MSKTFQRTLLEVFLSSMILDCNVTSEFLVQSGYLQEFFKLLFENWRQFKNSYERKLFALAITNFIFNCSNIPIEIKGEIGQFLVDLVSLLMR